MNLSSLLGSLLAQALAKPINKGATWLARQTEGPAKGNQFLANNASAVAAGESLLTNSLAQAATAHLDNDALAGKLGIPTTEQGIVAAAASAITGQSTLDLSQQGLLTDYLEQKIVQTTQPH